MLAFKRKLFAKTIVVVPPSTEATVIEVFPYSAGNSWAKIGFIAPERAAIHRIEILEEIAKFGNMRGASPTKEEAAEILANLTPLENE